MRARLWTAAPYLGALLGGTSMGVVSAGADGAAGWVVTLGLLALAAWLLAPVHWFLDLTRHFTSQLLLAAVAATAYVWACTGAGWLLRLASLLPTASWAIAMAPWIPTHRGTRPTPQHPRGRLRLFYANVLTESRSYDQIASLIRQADADVVALVEVDQPWVDALSIGAQGYVQMLAAPRPEHFGLALYSRKPLAAAAVIDLASGGMPALTARCRVGRRQLEILLLHTMPPKGPRRAALRDSQLRAAAELAARNNARFALIGDLNITPWSTAYRRLISSTGLVDGRHGHGICPTWPAALPAFLRLPIDQVLLGSSVRVQSLAVGARFGSDHLPLVLDLEVDQ